jgi:5-methylcytosine-specific restriction endonuclease McrA
MPKPPKKKSARRKPIPPGLRYDVLVRAKFRCEACGVPASQARLEIDHKIPVSQGGLTVLKNLQVLCLSCNRGKGAKVRQAKKRGARKPKPAASLTPKAAKKKGSDC